MHVAQEVHEEFESFVRNVVLVPRYCSAFIEVHPVREDVGYVADPTKDICTVLAGPTTKPGKNASLRGIVVHLKTRI